MHVIEHSHNRAEHLISTDLYCSVRGALQDISWQLADGTQDFRDRLMLELGRDGWSDPVRVDTVSKISITSVFDKTGLCAQTGNISRVYADLLKLETLYKKKIITGGIYIIPTKRWGKYLKASNMASYERLIEELRVFDATITLPLMVYGVQGDMQ